MTWTVFTPPGKRIFMPPNADGSLDYIEPQEDWGGVIEIDNPTPAFLENLRNQGCTITQGEN